MTDVLKNSNSGNDRPVVHPHLASQANFKGGDFDGIRPTIESGLFDDLGINTLWISPVNKTTDSAYQEWPEPHNYFPVIMVTGQLMLDRLTRVLAPSKN